MSAEPLRGSDAISVRELADMRSAGKEHTVLDVREARELDICRLEGALHIPMAEIPARTDDLPTNQLLVVICNHGARGQMVVDFLRSGGFDNAVTLTAASMLGLARSTDQCRAIDSVHSKRICDACR
jgi:rhodanese-related sulfurtransferase